MGAVPYARNKGGNGVEAAPCCAEDGTMAFNTLDALYITAAFVVPGYLMNWVISALASRKPEEKEQGLIRLLTLSCVNYVLWAWWIYSLYDNRYYLSHLSTAWAAGIVITIVSPLALGLLFGCGASGRWVHKALTKVRLHPMHPAPTAWEFLFTTQRDSMWVVVTLQDDSVVRGWYGKNSAAASQPGVRDLYIEAVYTLEGEDWVPVDGTAGIWLSGEAIKMVELIVNSPDAADAKEDPAAAVVEEEH